MAADTDLVLQIRTNLSYSSNDPGKLLSRTQPEISHPIQVFLAAAKLVASYVDSVRQRTGTPQ
jgi:hypothetical protein